VSRVEPSFAARAHDDRRQRIRERSAEDRRQPEAAFAAEARRALDRDQHAGEAEQRSEQHRPAHPFAEEQVRERRNQERRDERQRDRFRQAEPREREEEQECGAGDQDAARQVGRQHVAGQPRPALPPPHGEREHGAEHIAPEHRVRHGVRAGELLDRRIERAERCDARGSDDKGTRRGHRESTWKWRRTAASRTGRSRARGR
jgi:hypothetical protein